MTGPKVLTGRIRVLSTTPSEPVVAANTLSPKADYRALFAQGKSLLEDLESESTKTSSANTNEKNDSIEKWLSAIEPPSRTRTTILTTERAPQSARPSKDMSPRDYLSFASRFSNRTLASKEDISQADVQKAIDDAAHVVAAKDGKYVMDTFSELEFGRLRSGVYKTRKELSSVLNIRASRTLRSCGVSKASNTNSVACKFPNEKRNVRCKNHAYCRVVSMQQSTTAKYEAEKCSSPSNNPASVAARSVAMTAQT